MQPIILSTGMNGVAICRLKTTQRVRVRDGSAGKGIHSTSNDSLSSTDPGTHSKVQRENRPHKVIL